MSGSADISAPGESTSPPDLTIWRDRLDARPLRPYEALMGGEQEHGLKVARAHGVDLDEFLGRHWIKPSMKPDSLVPPVAWDEICREDRSLRYHVHALEPIGLPLAAYSHSANPRLIDYALALALDWLETHPSWDTGSPFAWYDMAVGLRTYRLAFLLDVVARDRSRADHAVRCLIDGIRLHMEVLAVDSNFAGHSNHGFYQAAGQLAAATRFPELDEMDRHRSQAEERLAAMIAAQFTSEGVHTEHSPGYHRMVLATLLKLIDCGLVTAPPVIERIESIEESLAWFVRPDGKLVTIGDTDAKPLPRNPFVVASSPALRLMATGGDDGSPPGDRVKAFPLSGYVVFRERWPSGTRDFADGAHLVQICGFHSRTHKHADDLSFTWFEHGRQILIDPGRFAYRNAGDLPPESARLGFMYSDPKRMYIESTRAHNTVEIDRQSYDRRAGPYGSALTEWGDNGELCWARSLLHHTESIAHTRTLLLMPGHFLFLMDDISDAAGDNHHFSQRFHAAPDLVVAATKEGLTLSPNDDRSAPLQVLSLNGALSSSVVTGQSSPNLLGWISEESGSFRPTPTFAFECDGVSNACFGTLFWWGSRGLAGIGHSADERDGQSGRRVWEWTAGDDLHRLTLTEKEGAMMPHFDRLT